MTELNQEMPKVLVRGLKKQYGDNVVLKSIDLTVNQGEVVCVIGPSGSGKSTMLRCLNRMEEINGGKVFVDGVDITDPKEDINKIRQNIGMVFQHFNLFPHLSVLDNITLAPMELKGLSKVEAESLALYLLESVGLADKAHVAPNSLSGGQKQRVAIARALAMQPDVLLFDEPTSALWSHTKWASPVKWPTALSSWTVALSSKKARLKNSSAILAMNGPKAS